MQTPPRVHVSRRGSVNITMGPANTNTNNPPPPRASSPNRVRTPLSENATKRRAAIETKKSYNRLNQQFKKVSTKSSKQFDELTSLKANKTKSDQQIHFLNKQIQRITAEKIKAESARKVVEEARRKIEQKLAGGSGGQYLAEKYQALRTRTRALKNRCEEQANVLESQETNLHKAASQIDILARALEVRVNELGLSGKRTKGRGAAAQVRDSLLYEVASQRSEMQSMAGELADNYDMIEKLRQRLIASETEAAQVSEEKSSTEMQAEEVLEKLEETRMQLSTREEELAKFGTDRDVMIDYIKEMQEEKMMREKESQNETTITSKMIEELKRKVNDLTQQNIVLEETNKMIEKRKKQLEKVQELTEGRLASEHVEVANMRAELMEAQQTCASLASETSTLRSTLEGRENQYASLETKAKLTDELRENTSEELRVLLDAVNDLERKNGQLEREKQRMEVDYQSQLNNVTVS